MQADTQPVRKQQQVSRVPQDSAAASRGKPVSDNRLIRHTASDTNPVQQQPKLVKNTSGQTVNDKQSDLLFNDTAEQPILLFRIVRNFELEAKTVSSQTQGQTSPPVPPNLVADRSRALYARCLKCKLSLQWTRLEPGQSATVTVSFALYMNR